MANAEYRPTTLPERRAFYEREFSVTSAKAWLRERKLPQLCAVDAGSETNVIVNRKLKDKLLYFPLTELEEKLDEYAPEDVYYDRNTYENPDKVLENLDFRNFRKYLKQELAFDIDVDNIPCTHPKNVEVCDLCLSKAFAWTLKMKKKLEEDFNKIRLVYSGRGFHVHVLDERAFRLTVRERGMFNKKLSRYPIDPWVSHGYIRLIRMPYTLNALVSRIVTPVDGERYFNPSKALPRFIKD